MRFHAALSLPLLFSPSAAQEPLAVESAIRKVRLHPDEAWITRQGTIQLATSGAHRIVLKGLPQGLTLEDVRIAARGPAGTRLCELSLRKEPQPYRDLPEWKRLGEELAKVEAEQFHLRLREQNQNQAGDIFRDLSEAQLKEVRHRMGAGEVKPQILVDLAAAIESRTLELARAKAAFGLEQARLEERKTKLAEAQEKLKQEAEARPVRVLAELDLPRPGTVEVELTYRSRAASWHPAYEARLSPDRSRLELVLLAAIKQSSEQDWPGVALELANQGTSGRLDAPAAPFLPALSFKEGEPPKATPVAEAGPATVQAAVSFRVPGVVDVPREEEQRFRVTSLDLTPSFRYLALPRQSASVYLLALVNPPPGFPLMPGSPLNLMQGQERLGTLSLEPPAPGEPLRLSFGAVPGLTATRMLVSQGLKEVGDKAKEREWTFFEKLMIASTLPGPAEIEVQDRQITSATASVTVSEEEGTTSGWKEVQPGLRSWSLTVGPGAQDAVQLRTRIRGPLVGRLVNLGDLTLEGNL